MVLLLTGVGMPLALGMLVAGGGILAAEIAENWDYVKDKISSFFDNNAALVVGIGIALVVIGIILICTGVGIPLGIGLIVAGGAAIGTEVALNWEFLKEKVKSIINAILKWVKTWGLLILGIVLCFTGVGIPLGIALIKKGANNLAEEKSPLWDTILTKLKSVWQKIKDFWNAHVKKYFTKDFWIDLMKKCGNGIIGVVEDVLNFLTSGIRDLVNGIASAIETAGEWLGLDWNIPKIPEIKLPRLAQGAVIPANREFLAVLGDQKHGTNIEAPAELIKQMAKEAYIEMGLNQQSQPSEIVIKFEGTESQLFQYLVPRIDKYNRQRGVNLLTQRQV